MSKTILKQLPSFATDQEAEHFVDTADLSEYDLSGFVPMHLGLSQPRDEAYVLVPLDLAEALREKAAAEGVSLTRLVRDALASSLGK